MVYFVYLFMLSSIVGIAEDKSSIDDNTNEQVKEILSDIETSNEKVKDMDSAYSNNVKPSSNAISKKIECVKTSTSVSIGWSMISFEREKEKGCEQE